MAEENLIQTNIVANANFAPLIADLNKVTLALSGLQEKLNASNKMLANNVSVMNKAFAETLRSTGQFSTHFVSLTSDVDKFGQQLSKGQIKLGQFFNVYKQHINSSGGIIRDLAKQQVQLQNAILQPLGRNAEGLMQYNVHIPRGLDTVKNKTALVKQELQIMNKVIQEGAGQMINWGKNTQWAGRQLTVGLTVPMAAFGKAAADAFKQADEQLVRLTKVYGGVAAVSKSELAKIRKDVAATATELAKSYGTSYTETISLAADIAATGKQGNELLKSTQETTRLAVLGEVSKQDAMKATLSIQNTFKQNTDQLAESVNFLNAVENQTSTTLQDLIEAIPKAGPVIKGMGGSVKDLALYLTAMKEGGISATEGANALKSGLASLINPTKVATGMFNSFGIDLKGIVTKNAGNLTQTILDLQSALETLNPLQKQQALEQLFGKFQFARMNALFSNLGKQGSQTLQVLDLMKASSQDLANIAGRELAQVTESASGKYKRAIEGLKADLAGIGDQFLTINTYLIKFVDGIIKVTQALPDPIKKALGFVGLLTAGLGPLVMMTGVLGNFFGYVIKGVSHFKSFFKGAEGWKLLTPEILAANKAGTLAEQTFYSDAKAAAILNQSLQALIGSYKTLEQQVQSGVISTTIVPPTGAAGLMRQVNPSSPYLSPKDTRSMSHLNPVAGMSMTQKMSQTMFGVVPGAPIVNAKIGKTPQMYMETDLPRIQGVSAVGKVSTGVVAQEAAQWHSMTAALGMQSKAEIAKLKQEIAATGLVTSEVSMAYETLLPKMNEITQKAAQASAIIVEDLRANKINAQEASAKIIALNAEIEQLMVQASQQVAKDLGRNINVTQVPMLNQPVVDPKTGKSNMKEMLKSGRNRSLLNKIAQGLGVKTYGAAYSIETTIPKRFAAGDIVPGTGNQDTVPAMLTPGEFVVRKDAVTPQTLPILQLLNNAKGGEQYKVLALLENAGINVPRLQNSVYPTTHSSNLQSRGGAEIPASTYLNEFKDPNVYKMVNILLSREGLNPITAAQHQQILQHLTENSGTGNTSESAFGRNLLNAYRAAGLSNEQIGVIRSSNTMRFAFPGEGSISQRRDSLIAQLEAKYSKDGIKFSRDPGSNQNIIVKAPGQKPFKIRHEATRGITRVTGGSSYEMHRQANPAGSRNGSQLAYAHIPLPEELAPLTNINPVSPSKMLPYSIQTHGRTGFLGMPLMRRGTGWTRLTKYTPMFNVLQSMKPSEYTPGVWRGVNRRRFATGGLVEGSATQHYARGGLVGGMLGQMLLSTAGYAGGSALGGMLGGNTGSFIGGMLGGSLSGGIGSMGGGYDLRSSYNKSVFNQSEFGLKLARNTLQGGRFTSMLSKMALGLTKTNLAIAGTTTALAIAYKLYKDHENSLKSQALGYGLTAEAAQKAGLTYVDINAKMKEGIANSKALAERNKLIYSTLTQSNTPLKISIEEYKKLKQQIKETMPEYIKLINVTKKQEIGDLAIRLKAEFMAAGDSAENATKKVYALIEASNKRGLGGTAVGSQAFGEITNASQAAATSAKTYNAAMETRNVKAQAQSLLTTLGAIDTGIAQIITDSEKAAKADKTHATKVKEYSTAQKEQMNLINSKIKEQKKLTVEVIDEIAKQNPELASVLNVTDSIESAWAKYRITLQGTTLDLSTMSDKAVIALNQMNQEINAAVTANLKSGVLASKYSDLQKLKDAQAAAAKAAKGQSIQSQINSRNEIDALNKKIDAINKEADARKKALQEQQQDEDILTQIKKKQLEYQDALSVGNMSAAAQAQLDIKSLTGQQQRTLAERAIDAKRAADIAPLQAAIDALNAANQKVADAASLAGDKLNSFAKKISDLETIISNVDSAVAKIERGIAEGGVNYKGKQDDLAALYKFLKEGGLSGNLKTTYQTSPELVNGKPVSITKEFTPAQLGQKYLDALTGLTQNINTNQVIVNAKEVLSKEKPVIGTFKGGVNYTNYAKTEGTVNALALTSDKISTKTGTTFKDKYGMTWKVMTAPNPAGDIQVQKMEMGGSVKAGQMYVVGEKRPELFVPNTNGTIIPNIPKFLNGINNVPYDMQAILHKGEKVLSPSQAMNMSSAYSNDTFNVTMNFANAPENARELFNQFKAILSSEQRNREAMNGRPRYV